MTFNDMNNDGIEVEDGWGSLAGAHESDRRRYMRFPLELDGRIVIEGRPNLVCKVLDFSAHGMRLEHHPDEESLFTSRPRPVQALDGNGELVEPEAPRTLEPGDLISVLIGLPGERKRIRATTQLRRLLHRRGPVEIGVQYARISPDVYRSLMRASDDRRFKRTENLSPRELAAAVSHPWQHTALLLETAVSDFFSRVLERLKLYAEVVHDQRGIGPYYFALVSIKSHEERIASIFVRAICDQILGRASNLTEDLDEWEQTTIELPELDPHAPAYKWDLERIGNSCEPFSARLLNTEHSPITPPRLQRAIVGACEELSLAPEAVEVVEEVAGEIARLQFAQLQRILRPIAWGDQRAVVRRKKRRSIDLGKT